MTARPAPDWLTGWEFAHRGLHGPGVPENSLVAAEGAIARGMGIECDIQMSADGVPIVFHDWELSRLTSVEGMVGAQTAAALEALDPRSRRIVEERWLKVNDDGSGGMTLHELAAEYGVSAERIRQIEVAAMKKMKKALVEFA